MLWNQEKSKQSRQIMDGETMLATLDRLERVLQIIESEGISVRRDWLRGVRGGLVRLGSRPVLFLDESLAIPEQYAQVRDALLQLDWSETDHFAELVTLLDLEVAATVSRPFSA